MSDSTGSPISSRRRANTGIAITVSSRRITRSGRPSRRWRKGNVGKQRDAVTGGHGGDSHGSEDCCNAKQQPRSHDTSRIAWAKLMARVGEGFRSSARRAAATSASEETAGRSRLTRSERFASGRRPGWLRPPEVSPSRTWANHSNRLRCHPPEARPPTGASSRKSTSPGPLLPRLTSRSSARRPLRRCH